MQTSVGWVIKCYRCCDRYWYRGPEEGVISFVVCEEDQQGSVEK